MMIVDFATDFSESARDKLTRMNVDSGIFMFPFATEYRKQGNERKYHVFYLMGKGNINYKTVWITAKHTPACLVAREKERIERAAYEQRWPRYCQRCDGKGGSSSREYRGECHGTPASEQVFNYCPHCIGQGICPRCGSISNNFEDDDVEQLECATCGWTEGDPGCPVVEADCGCYEDALDTERPFAGENDDSRRTS